MMRDYRQSEVGTWILRCFGWDVAMNRRERVSRLLEEAVELAQAENLPIAEADRILRHVYAKPPGDPAQEVGGVSITLLGYCAAAGLSADQCEYLELHRVLSLPPDHFRKRQNAKALAGVGLASQ